MLRPPMDALFCVPGMAIHIEEETAHAPRLLQAQPLSISICPNRLRIMYHFGSSLVLTTGFAEGSLINVEFESAH